VPGRDAWPALLADPQTPARLREQLERLVEIEAAGGEVLVRACDLTDAGQLAAVVDEATARFGGLHGAFHSAGVPGGGMLAVRTRADAERVLAPKVAGTLALHRVLGGRVDFIVLFSSLSAVAADFGLVDYCAANAFQDAFARFTAARGEPVYSIGWTRWRGHGMGATDGSLPLIVRELHAGTRSEPVEHPLLDRRVYGDGDNIVFSTVLRPDAHWIITEHTIGEVQVVPGTALIEMIRAGFAEAFGPGPVELRDVVFVDPITVTEPTELRLVLRPADDGYDASVAVTRASTAYLTRVEHCRARVRRGAIEAAPAHDLAVLAARCPVPVGGNPGDGEQPEWLVRYGQHWNAVGAGRLGDGEEITHMALPEPFRAECADYVLHPGLLDAAVSLARRSTTAGVDSPAFLPLAYGRIVVRSPLPPTFIVHTRHTDPAERDEFVSDIVLVDDDGRELVRVERYTGRRVAAEAVRSGIAALAAPVRPGGAGPANGGRDEGAHGPDWSLTEPTAMDILRRILHHRPEPHVLVCTEGLERVFGLLAQLTGETLARELAKAELPVSTSAERTVATPYVAPEDDLQRLLAELLANALGLAQVGVDDDFFELGGNSLVAVQLGIRLRERLGTDVPIASLLDRPTVRGLAAALEKMLTDARQPGRHPRLDSVG
jgi:phthiocerol/phenolphthiocerol synthesis type-I polyketide synthase E